MIKKDLVSVIIISYQSERYIIDALESVKNQSWQDIELIVSDDASTDNTVKLCSDWLSQNKDRFYQTKLITGDKNIGIPGNCDRGLKSSTGIWIKFIGADDILIEDCIKDNMHVINEIPSVSLVISDLIEINPMGEVLRESPENEGLKYFMKNQKSKKQKLKAYARWPAFLNTPTFFYRKDLITDIYIPNLDFKIFEDTSTVFHIIENGANIHYLKKPTVKYRIHKKAISRDEKYLEKREKESYRIYKIYRRKYLSPFNPIDLSVFYESWLRFKFKGIRGHKGMSVLKHFSIFHWYLRYSGIRP